MVTGDGEFGSTGKVSGFGRGRGGGAETGAPGCDGNTDRVDGVNGDGSTLGVVCGVNGEGRETGVLRDETEMGVVGSGVSFKPRNHSTICMGVVIVVGTG